MREIKFRQAKCGAKGNFVDWFYWGFLDDGSGLHFVAPLQHNVDNFQYTGLKDKNGKEIYEGDILKYAGLEGYLVVKWETFGWRLENTIPEIDRYIQRLSWPPIQLPSGNFEHIEIIGNIHQNPELLSERSGTNE